jgi:hypothetical protein
MFNHRFDKNIEKLEAIYAPRFSRIFHLMPFYEGHKANVIPVYERSLYFQGSIAQAFHRLCEHECEAYVVVADDLILHPSLNEDNILSELGVSAGEAYIKNLCSLTRVPLGWLYFTGSAQAVHSGREAFSELPPVGVAAQRIRRQGIELGRYGLHNLEDWFGRPKLFYGRGLGDPRFWKILLSNIVRGWLPYPLVMGYSDFLVVPAAAMREFARLCGVFAAMELFAEVAIPTALSLTCEKIATEIEVGGYSHGRPRAGVRWRGTEIWGGHDLGSEHSGDLSSLLRSFTPNQLYIHPVKLSKWRVS